MVIIDTSIDEIKTSIAAINKLFPNGTPNLTLATTPKNVKNADDAINLFLKNFGL